MTLGAEPRSGVRPATPLLPQVAGLSTAPGPRPQAPELLDWAWRRDQGGGRSGAKAKGGVAQGFELGEGGLR